MNSVVRLREILAVSAVSNVWQQERKIFSVTLEIKGLINCGISSYTKNTGTLQLVHHDECKTIPTFTVFNRFSFAPLHNRLKVTSCQRRQKKPYPRQKSCCTVENTSQRCEVYSAHRSHVSHVLCKWFVVAECLFIVPFHF